MMKLIIKWSIFLFCVFLSIESYAQDIRFELYIKDICNDSIGKVMFFNLRKKGIDFYPKNNDGIVILKEIGKYELSTIYSDDIKYYTFKDFGIVRDTINMSVIRECLEPTSHPGFIGYCCCDIECEGEKVDYYRNGNKRIEGYFKKGKPIGKLKTYYPNGDIKQIDKFNKKGMLIESKKYVLKGCE